MATRNTLKRAAQAAWRWLHEFTTGAALSWVAVPLVLKRRDETERLFCFTMLMQAEGLPLLPPRERLFLLPILVPHIMTWRRRLRLWDDSLETVDLKHIGH